MPEAPTQPIAAVLDLEKAMDESRQEVIPLVDPAQEENWDGVKLKSKELAILQAGLRLVGHCIARLIYRLGLTQSIQIAVHVRSPDKAALPYTRDWTQLRTRTAIPLGQPGRLDAVSLLGGSGSTVGFDLVSGHLEKRGQPPTTVGACPCPVLHLAVYLSGRDFQRLALWLPCRKSGHFDWVS